MIHHISPPCIDQSENNSPLQDNLDLPDGALPHDSPHVSPPCIDQSENNSPLQDNLDLHDGLIAEGKLESSDNAAATGDAANENILDVSQDTVIYSCPEDNTNADNKLKKKRKLKLKCKTICSAKQKKQKLPIQLKCNFCDDVFHTNKERNHHILQNHSRHKFKCKQCGKNFKTDNGHYKCERRHQEKCFHCSKCDNSFSLKSDLKQHAVVHKKS